MIEDFQFSFWAMWFSRLISKLDSYTAEMANRVIATIFKPALKMEASGIVIGGHLLVIILVKSGKK